MKLNAAQVWQIMIQQHMILTCKTLITIHNLFIQYWDQKCLYALLHWQNYQYREFDIKWHIISVTEKELRDLFHKMFIIQKWMSAEIYFNCDS